MSKFAELMGQIVSQPLSDRHQSLLGLRKLYEKTYSFNPNKVKSVEDFIPITCMVALAHEPIEKRHG